ncbi:MAG: cache domain-containing protein [Pseudomonadota bacterium]
MTSHRCSTLAAICMASAITVFGTAASAAANTAASAAPQEQSQPASAPHATREQAVALVQKAVALIGKIGKDKALAQFSDPQGGFVDRELYIVVLDFQGTSLANGNNRKMIGKQLMELRDVDGRYFARESVALAKTSGKGWLQPFTFVNPANQALEKKLVYLERVDDYLVLSGVYQ